MKFTVLISFLLCVCLQYTQAKHLPSGIVACKRNDANLNACATEHANAAISILLPGIKEYNIPSLNPLLVSSVEVQAGQNLKMKFNNIKVNGLDKAVIKDLSIDLAKHHLEMHVTMPQLVMEGEYEIDGKILVLPIKGKGPGVLSYIEPLFTVSFDYDLTKKGGKDHIKVKNEKFTYTIKKATYKLDNLFNGDAKLGGEMNNFLNENWEPVSTELAPVFAESMKSVIVTMFIALLESVPTDELFLP